MRLLLLFLFHLFSLNSTSQISTLYPIKQNHLWGYMNDQGEVILQPQYDAIADKNIRWNQGITSVSPFRLVEKDGKLGLVDGNGEIVVTPNWKEIRPISTNLFAVRSNVGFRLINREGISFLANEYDDVQLIVNGLNTSRKYYKVKKDSHWGIYHLDKGEIIAPKFSRIRLSSPLRNHFQVSSYPSSAQWGLVDDTGKRILPSQFTAIKVLHQNCIIAKNKYNQWEVYDSLGVPIGKETWSTYRELNEYCVGYKTQNGQWNIFLFNSHTSIDFETQYEAFAPLSKGYIKGKSKRQWGIIDSLGNELITPTFNHIKPFNPPIFKIFDGDWGLYSLTKGIIVPTDYQSINSFENGLAKVLKNEKWGMINDTGAIVIPLKFESFLREENFIKAFSEPSMTLFELDENNQVISEEFFEEVYNIRVGYNIPNIDGEFKMSDIRRENNRVRQSRKNFRPIYRSDTTVIENTNWLFEKNPINNHYALIDKSKDKAITAPAFMEVHHITNGRLTMVFTEQPFANNRVAAYATFPTDTACAMALFSHDLGKFITDFDMMGLRRHDFERGLPYAAFIDLKGEMGLIDRNGNILKNNNGQPLSYSFIDDFQHGKTRVCLNGRLSIAQSTQDSKISISGVKMFTHGFFVTSIHPFDNSSITRFFLKNKSGTEIKWGYIDSLGNTLIEPQYEFVNQFVDSVALNKQNGGWGLINEQNEVLLDFIYKGIAPFKNNHWRLSFANSKPIFFNSKGHEVINLKYNKFGGFSDDMCKVRVDSLWGFVDKTGKEVITCQFKNVRNFSEGLAAVFIKEKWIFIDKTGKKVLFPNKKIKWLEAVGDFKNGLCWYKEGKFYGYFGKNGVTKIKPQYTKVFDFEKGVARVVFDKKTGLIDTLGNWVLNPKDFEVIFPFNEEGIAVIRKKFNQKSGLINKYGEVLTELKYIFIGEFENGYAKISAKTGYGIVNTKGHEVIPAIYKEVKMVANGLVAVMPYSKFAWHYRNLKNERAFNGEFEKAENFNEGLAQVQVYEFDYDSKMWIDTLGKVVNPTGKDFIRHYSEGVFCMFSAIGVRRNFRSLNFYFCDAAGHNLFNQFFEDIQPFENGTAPVKIKNRWGIINRSGMTLIQPKYSRINQTEDGWIHTKPSLLLGLTTKKGKEILPPIFDDIHPYKNLIRVELGEKIGYTTPAGEWVWELQN